MMVVSCYRSLMTPAVLTIITYLSSRSYAQMTTSNPISAVKLMLLLSSKTTRCKCACVTGLRSIQRNSVGLMIMKCNLSPNVKYITFLKSHPL